MKKKSFLLAALVFIGFSVVNAQTKLYPLVKSYGAVWEIPDADQRPDPKMKYKILIELTEGSAKSDTLNIYLEAVATLINMHAVEGVPKENLDFIVVLRKMATNSILNNEYYNERFKTDNPNLQLIKELEEAGVKFYVCGQTLIRAKIDRSKLLPQAKVATAVLTAMTTFQLQGYKLIKF